MEQTETNLAIIEAAIASVGPGADLSAIAEHLRGT
jgi:hypothetical protein